MIKSKICFLLLILTASLSYAQTFSGSGHSFGGSIGVGGLLKSLIIPNSVPIGKISSSYGYEVWDFSKALSSNDRQNRASFCYSTIEMVLDTTVLGVSFGGEVSHLKTIGECPNNSSALTGEGLFFTLTFDVGSETKSIPLSYTLGYGFDLDQFSKILIDHFSYNNPNNRTPAQRMWRLHSHLFKYLITKEVRKVLDPRQMVLLKILLSPTMLAKGTANDYILSKNEVDYIRFIASKGMASINQTIFSALQKIRNDSSFYKGADEEIQQDFLKYKDALARSMSDCHSISVNGGVMSEFSLSINPELKVDLGFGYAITEKDRAFTSKLSTMSLATKEYALHRVRKHSKECRDLSSRTAVAFGRFLSLVGYEKTSITNLKKNKSSLK